MYQTEKEIRSQFFALRQTVDYITEKQTEIIEAFNDAASLCVIGCGSSYSLAKSAALQFTQLNEIPAFAIAAGDLMVNFPQYEKLICNATLLVLSRSGSTSEVVAAVRRCRETYGSKVISLCAKQNAPIEALADLNLVIPWAFDDAVCQTRTVSNLYAAGLLIAATVAHKTDEVKTPCLPEDELAAFCAGVEEPMRLAGQGDWTKAVVLADSAVGGLAEEGALAFREICRRDSNYYHLLDVRHGPIVQIRKDTLVLAFLSDGAWKPQTDLIADVAKKTEQLYVFSRDPRVLELKNGILLPDCGCDATSAVYLLYCIQLLTLSNAVHHGVDPDVPEGLAAWIQL